MTVNEFDTFNTILSNARDLEGSCAMYYGLREDLDTALEKQSETLDKLERDYSFAVIGFADVKTGLINVQASLIEVFNEVSNYVHT